MISTASNSIVLGPRVVPSRRFRFVLNHNFTFAQNLIGIFVSGFFEPVFYLLSMSVGVGKLIGDIDYLGSSVEYVAFVAPALLATSAMNGAIFESTMNVYFRLTHGGTYVSMVATPISPRDVAIGELVWCQLRGLFYSVPFLVMMAGMGLVESWWGVLALPAVILVGVTFAALGLAASTFMRTFQDLEFVTMAVMPMFLLSATFFPLETYSPSLQRLVQLTPLYHGVALLRQLTLDAVSWTALGHVGYLLVVIAVAASTAFRRFDKLLRA